MSSVGASRDHCHPANPIHWIYGWRQKYCLVPVKACLKCPPHVLQQSILSWWYVLYLYVLYLCTTCENMEPSIIYLVKPSLLYIMSMNRSRFCMYKDSGVIGKYHKCVSVQVNFAMMPCDVISHPLIAWTSGNAWDLEDQFDSRYHRWGIYEGSFHY